MESGLAAWRGRWPTICRACLTLCPFRAWARFTMTIASVWHGKPAPSSSGRPSQPVPVVGKIAAGAFRGRYELR